MLESDIADSAEASRQECVFVTKAADRDAVAQAELEKALASGKPVTSPNYTRADDGLEKGAPARFHTVESVAPGTPLLAAAYFVFCSPYLETTVLVARKVPS
jgi:hypothetical protein